MKKYIIKYVPSDGPIKMGDKVLDKTDGRIITVTEIYEDKDMNGKQVIMIGDAYSCSNQCVKVSLHLCSNEINTGDKIVVFSTDGVTSQIRGVETGILTRKWDKDDYPECEIDGKPFDLVSEGHTSNVFKIICPLEISPNNHWIKENMEFEDDEVRIEKCWDYKKAKYLDVNDIVEVNDGSAYPLEGKIKEVRLKYIGASDDEDEIVLTNVRKAVSFDPTEQNGWIFAPRVDMIVKRSKIQDRKKVVFECEIKCPCCGHFCYSC